MGFPGVLVVRDPPANAEDAKRVYSVVTPFLMEEFGSGYADQDRYKGESIHQLFLLKLFLLYYIKDKTNKTRNPCQL